MNQELWRRAEELFHAALERTPEARPAFLDEACGAETELRRQVAVLISNDEQAGSLLEEPVLADLTTALAADGSLVGRQIGPYRILSLLGEGGMGAVYRAHDSKLGRDVAIKTLPPEFARDPSRLARLRREARTLASLNHPNIGAIYGLEESGEVDCLVLELVEGDTLCGPLPVQEALDCAHQVAQALEAAHAKGIIHRDLKPANVKITSEGRVKVLDFGLAKAILGQDGGGDLSQVASMSGTETLAGRIMGTPGYMSPEQARGEKVDQRTDIWAFGCLLYELLTGKRAFQGDKLSETLAAVLEREPEWQVLPVKTPAKIRELLRRCLQKDFGQRLSSIRDARGTIEQIQGGFRHAKLVVATAAALLVIIVSAIIYSRVAVRPTKPEVSKPTSFTQLTDQPGRELYPSLSPDGNSFVYASQSSGNWDVYFQRVGGRTAVNLTKDSPYDDTQPLFSPDGEQIAFRSERDGGGIFAMDATGENVRRITDFGYNPAWSPDGSEIVCASANFERPDIRLSFHSQLFSVKISTGEKRQLTPGVDFAMQPNWSPHGHRIAYWGVVGSQWDIWTIPSTGGQPVRVTDDAAIDWNPAWSPDGSYLYFASDRSGSMNIWRVPIEEKSGKVLGDFEAVTTPSPYAAYISFSRNGRKFAYVERTSTNNIYRIGFDPVRGSAIGQPNPVTRGSLMGSTPDVSPDGGWVTFTTQGGKKEDLYVVREDGTSLRQLTDDAYRNRVPAWSPDGKRIAFYSNRTGKFEIWAIHPDGSGLERLTYTPDGFVHYPSWSPNGTHLVYGVQNRTPYVMEVNKPWGAQIPQPLPPLNIPGAWFAASRWSPDGQKFAGWQVRTDGLFMGISIYSFDSSKYERITDFGGYPRWLNDSRRLLFTDSRTSKVYWVDSHSRQVHEIAGPAGIVSMPADNRWIYFERRIVESDVWLAKLE